MIQELGEYTELMLFLFLEKTGSFLVEAVSDKENLKDLEIVNKCLELSRIIRLGVLETQRFGVNDIVLDEHINSINPYPSEQYKTWYTFWKSWFIEMEPEKYCEFKRKFENGEDVSEYLPKNKWNESTEEE